MIKIYEGATLREATENLIKAIDNNDMDIQHYLIVPDRFSLLAEKMLLQYKGKSLFNIEVVGISSLLVKLLEEAGQAKPVMVSSSDGLLIMSEAVKKAECQVFKKGNINFCHELYKIVSQLKSSGVKPEELISRPEKKFQDIGNIYREYENLLAGRVDANGLIEYFNASMSGGGAKNKEFYFAQFDSLTYQTYCLVGTLTKYARSISFAIAKPISKSNEYIYEDDIFVKVKDLALQLGQEVQVISMPSALDRGAMTIVKNLYAFEQIDLPCENNFLTLVSASDIQKQISLAGKIIKYQANGGMRYKDFALACGDLQLAEPIIEKVFGQLDIPYYIDSSITCDKTILAKFLFQILNVLIKDFSAESLQSLCVNKILALEDSAKLCEKISSYAINGKARFYRYIQNEKLTSLFKNLEGKRSYLSLASALTAIIEEFSLNYEQLLSSIQEEYPKQYNINLQAREFIVESLQKIGALKGEEECSFSEMSKLLSLILSFKEMSSVPTFVDAVMVGDASASYFEAAEHLILIGGEKLPLLSGDNGILSDDDIFALSQVKAIDPTIRMINRRNRFKLFNLLSLARKKLTIMFSEIGDEGKKIELPSYIDSLTHIFNTKILPSESFSQMSGINQEADMARLILSSGSEKMLLEENYQIAKLLGLREDSFEIDKSNIDTDGKALFFGKGYTKATELECYFSCPFKHFIRYGLRAKEEASFDFDARDSGNICHELAQQFVEKYKSEIFKIKDSEITEFINQNLEKTIEKLKIKEKIDAARDKEGLISYLNKLTFLLLSRIVREQQQSKFRPLYTEKTVQTKLCDDIKLIGKIDRIDIAGDYFRVIDYKTGRVNPILKDLYYGDKLQLFLYEGVAAQMLGKRSAGAFYFDGRYDFEKLTGTDVLLKGVVANDEEAIKLFDENITSKKSEVIAISPKVKGGFTGSALAKFPLENFDNYAKSISAQAVDEIMEGYIAPKPDAASCERCEYRSICQFNREQGFRVKEKTSQEDIIAALGGENEE